MSLQQGRPTQNAPNPLQSSSAQASLSEGAPSVNATLPNELQPTHPPVARLTGGPTGIRTLDQAVMSRQ
ncbi:MAG TPA: hypothetical protein V6D19_03745, partial [Stenomitos sp.]